MIFSGGTVGLAEGIIIFNICFLPNLGGGVVRAGSLFEYGINFKSVLENNEHIYNNISFSRWLESNDSYLQKHYLSF